MNNFKKIISVLLAVLMVASIGVIAVCAAGYDFVAVKWDNDALKDGDWYFDAEAQFVDFYNDAYGIDPLPADVDANRDAMKTISELYFDEATGVIKNVKGSPEYLLPGDEGYDYMRSYIKQAEVDDAAPVEPIVVVEQEGKLCNYCGQHHDQSLIGGWVTALLHDILFVGKAIASIFTVDFGAVAEGMK